MRASRAGRHGQHGRGLLALLGLALIATAAPGLTGAQDGPAGWLDIDGPFGLRTDGEVVCRFDGELRQLPKVPDGIQLEWDEDRFLFVLRGDGCLVIGGGVWCWGSNGLGQLGSGG